MKIYVVNKATLNFWWAQKSNNKYTKSISSLLIDGSHQSDAVIIIIY